MRLLTAAEQRALDRLALDEAGLPTRALMESAGAAVAAEVRRGEHDRVLGVCGPRNNGGVG
ncbi:MAG: bifunctional ADP-dependent NAD(P)H-hydrate dehydratase/NAD(P)H-hydrate epimerase, partial [Deltaproteobacteria bacterium]|nr:bifunctional ADP-dependent NAD(P)H-hydrate dehydratase/NAD(P)H-hydrate epimerase [Deltaproteobacteria bacterium]